MKILALESSAAACSAALCEDETLIAQFFQNSGLTHSVTLLPMADDLLRRCGVGLEQVDLIAAAAGPGSFTGLRIGVSAAKGLAWPGNKPCAACSTLESMAWGLAHTGMEICPVMDARRKQVYNARFLGTGEGLERLAPDRAIALEELAAELKKSGKPQILVGFMLYCTQGSGAGRPPGSPPSAAAERLGRGPLRPGAGPVGRAHRRRRPDAQLPPPLPG